MSAGVLDRFGVPVRAVGFDHRLSGALDALIVLSERRDLPFDVLALLRFVKMLIEAVALERRHGGLS